MSPLDPVAMPPQLFTHNVDLNRLGSILGIQQYFPVYVPPAPWCASAGAMRNPYKVAFPAKSGCEWQTGPPKVCLLCVH